SSSCSSPSRLKWLPRCDASSASRCSRVSGVAAGSTRADGELAADDDAIAIGSETASTRSRETIWAKMRMRSAFHLRDVLKHLVGSLNRLGINFVGALGDNEVHHFFDDVDIRRFDVALH